MSVPEPGSLLAVPLPNGTCAVIWLLDVQSSEHRFMMMEGFFAKPPTGKQLAALKLAPSQMPPLPGEENVSKGWFKGRLPADFTVLGARALPAAAERWLRSEGTMIFQDAEHVRSQLFLTWRLDHDRPALEAEWAAAEKKQAERKATQRKNRTLKTMLAEKPFASWSRMWGPAVVKRVRSLFTSATRELIALEKSGTASKRTKVFTQLVEDLNVLADEKGGIETDEREQLVERIDQLAELVGLTNEDEQLTGERDW